MCSRGVRRGLPLVDRAIFPDWESGSAFPNREQKTAPSKNFLPEVGRSQNAWKWPVFPAWEPCRPTLIGKRENTRGAFLPSRFSCNPIHFLPATEFSISAAGGVEPAPGGRPSLRDTRARLLQAAIQVFSEMGYRAASTRAIAQQAKINQVTLFRLFDGKAQLYATVVKQLLATSDPLAKLEPRLAKSRAGASLIRVSMQAISEVMFQNPALYRIILYSSLENDVQAARSIWRAWGPVYRLLARHIDASIQAHQLRRVDPMAAARLIVAAALRHYEIYELHRGKTLPRFRAKDLSSHYADIIYYGLKAD